MGNYLRQCRGDADTDDKIDFGGGNVQLINSKEIWDEKIAEANKNGKIVVANFSASWCGPCRVITPLYAEMSEKYPQLIFLTIDVDELTILSKGVSWLHVGHMIQSSHFCKDVLNLCKSTDVKTLTENMEQDFWFYQDLSSSWDIRATPTFFFLKDGKQLAKIVGANRLELEKKVLSFAESATKSSG